MRAGAVTRVSPLYLVVFIGFLGYSLMITVFTPLILREDGGMLPSSTPAATRTLVLGGVLAIYPLAQFVGSPILGALSDRFGRRPVLLASLLASTALYGLLALALHLQSLPLLVLACLLAGLSEANIAIAQSAIADVSTAADRGRLFGYVYLCASFAYVVGPLGGGKLADPALVSWFGYPTPFLAVAALLLLNLLFAAVRFRETHRPPMYLVDHFGMGVSRESELIAWVAVPIVLANLGLVAWLSRRLDPRRLKVRFAIALAFCLALVVVPHPEGALWVTLFACSLALAVCLPSMAAMISAAVGPAEQGAALGSNQSLQVGAEGVSGLAGGGLAAISTTLPLPAMGALALLGAGLLGRSRARRAVESAPAGA